MLTFTRDEAGVAATHEVVVVLDVLRAFTTAALALATGAARHVLVATPDEAFAARERWPDALLVGEDGARPITGFDLSNSPAELLATDVVGRTLVHRSSSGTRAALAAAEGDAEVWGASLVNAHATAAAIGPDRQVAHVLSGAAADRQWDDADDDRAGAQAIHELLHGEPDLDALRARVLASRAASRLRELGLRRVEADLRLATSDLRAPALRVVRDGDVVELVAVRTRPARRP